MNNSEHLAENAAQQSDAAEVTPSSQTIANALVGSSTFFQRVRKFRLWDGKMMLLPQELYGDIRNEYALSMYGDVYYFEEESNGQYCPATLASKTKHGCTIMDFIGLTDKIGKDVYEGDILGEVGDPNCFVVVWDKKYAAFGYILQNNGYKEKASEITEDFVKEQQVIGNVFENPELLG